MPKGIRECLPMKTNKNKRELTTIAHTENQWRQAIQLLMIDIRAHERERDLTDSYAWKYQAIRDINSAIVDREPGDRTKMISVMFEVKHQKLFDRAYDLEPIGKPQVKENLAAKKRAAELRAEGVKP